MISKIRDDSDHIFLNFNRMVEAKKDDIQEIDIAKMKSDISKLVYKQESFMDALRNHLNSLVVV
jgi:hypothetical protein